MSRLQNLESMNTADFLCKFKHKLVRDLAWYKHARIIRPSSFTDNFSCHRVMASGSLFCEDGDEVIPVDDEWCRNLCFNSLSWLESLDADPTHLFVS